MGCLPSKHTNLKVDDSVHVMLKHAKQTPEEEEIGFVPRSSHPLLKPKRSQATIVASEIDTSSSGSGGQPVSTEDHGEQARVDALLALCQAETPKHSVDTRTVNHIPQ